jgi:hypothetical protein
MRTSLPITLAAIIALSLLAACAGTGSATPQGTAIQPVEATPSLFPVAVEATSPPPSPTPAIPTATEQLYAGPRVTDVKISLPEGWFYAYVENEHFDSLVFTQQDPAELSEFDDPQLALPLDFAAGALVLTPLPEGSDPQALQNALLEGISELDEDDFEAMLFALDQVGLINYAAVDHATLLTASAGEMAARPALVLDGTLYFEDDLPPALRVQIWLAVTQDAWLAFYGLAAEKAWPGVQPALAQTQNSIQLP